MLKQFTEQSARLGSALVYYGCWPALFSSARWQVPVRVSHLPRAINAQSPKEISALVKMVPKERPVVLYCSVGIRSSKAADQLIEAGRTNVFNLKGSIFQWANEGRTVERQGKPVTEVHPYDNH